MKGIAGSTEIFKFTNPYSKFQTQ